MIHKLYDKREPVEVAKMTGEEPLFNPYSWKLFNKWEDGFHLVKNIHNNVESMLWVENNVVIGFYDLNKRERYD